MRQMSANIIKYLRRALSTVNRSFPIHHKNTGEFRSEVAKFPALGVPNCKSIIFNDCAFSHMTAPHFLQVSAERAYWLRHLQNKRYMSVQIVHIHTQIQQMRRAATKKYLACADTR